MTSPRTTSLGIAVVAAAISGAIIAFQGRFNGALSEAGAGVLVAGWFSYAGTVATAAVILLARDRGTASLTVISARGQWWWFPVGLCGIPIVLTMTATIPLLGVAIVSVCAVAGQTVAGLLLDSRGFGVPAPIRFTNRRVLAAAGAIAGLGIAVLGSRGTTVTPAMVAIFGVALFLSGAVLCIQQAGNGRVVELTGDPLLSVLTSASGGTVGMTVIVAVSGASGGLSHVSLPSQWWLYLGGPLGTLITLIAAWAVRHLGTFVLTLSVVGGQMLAAILLDLGSGVAVVAPTLVATAVVIAAAVLASAKPRARSADTPAGEGS